MTNKVSDYTLYSELIQGYDFGLALKNGSIDAPWVTMRLRSDKLITI